MTVNLSKNETPLESQLRENNLASLRDVSTDVPNDPIADNEVTAEVTWLEMSKAFDALAHFANALEEGSGRDYTCNFEHAQEMYDNLVLAREGIEWVTEQLAEYITHEVQYHQEETGNYLRLEALLVPLVETSEDTH